MIDIPGLNWISHAMSVHFMRRTHEEIAPHMLHSGQTAADVLQTAQSVFSARVTLQAAPDGLSGPFYDPETRQIFLPESLFSSSSLAAVALAAHIYGHAMAHQSRKPPRQTTLLTSFTRFRQQADRWTNRLFWVLLATMALLFLTLYVPALGDTGSTLSLLAMTICLLLGLPFLILLLLGRTSHLLVKLVILWNEHRANHFAYSLLRRGHFLTPTEYSLIRRYLSHYTSYRYEAGSCEMTAESSETPSSV